MLSEHGVDDAAHAEFRQRWNCAPGELPVWFVSYVVTGRRQDRDTQRQVRRALESLERRGLVTKRLVNHNDYKGGGVRAFWKLT